MTVRRLDDGVIVLEGDCAIGEAEPLLRYLLAAPDAQIDWRGCDKLHAAVLQVLLASGRSPIGPAQGTFLNEFIAPVLRRIGH